MPADRCILSLESGEHFFGLSGAAAGCASGEVVFNTSMTGYQEICTDPSYRGQIVTLAYPLINNYGANYQDPESRRPWLSGLIVRELAGVASNWRNKLPLAEYLSAHQIPIVVGVDTRRLVRILRSGGVRRGLITPIESTACDSDRFSWARGSANLKDGFLDELTARARAVVPLSEKNLVEEVTHPERFEFADDDWTPWPRPTPRRHRSHIALLDTGAKSNIARSLTARGCRVSVLPYETSVEQIRQLAPDGVVVGNGPGDPIAARAAVSTTQALLRRYPTMGICLGHQILALAIGASTSRLKFGHRGANHPVKELSTGRVCITAQNHGFQVNADSLPADSGYSVSHINLNDGSVEGLKHESLPVFSVQYHPEAAPGPQDNQHLFDRFLDLVEAQ